jgi:hypothetical protein
MGKLRILGNCQVGGIADSISLLVNEVEIIGEVAPSETVALSAILDDHLECQGLLILSNSVKHLIENNESLARFDRPDNIYFPSISFAAFHPDIQYVFSNGSVVKNCLGGDWNSRILLWSYLNSLSQSSTLKLFCEENYESLGYLDEWDRSSETLQRAFQECDFNYGRWITAVQRHGAFMYGINHPTQYALSELAIQLAEKIFPESNFNKVNLNGLTTDYLSHIVWPIYPEVGDRLGLETSCHWRHLKKIIGLSDFLNLSFAAFDQIELRKKVINMIPSNTVHQNLVLRTGAGL